MVVLVVIFSVLFLVLIMFSSGYFAPVKRLAGKIIFKITYNMSSETLNLSQLD